MEAYCTPDEIETDGYGNRIIDCGIFQVLDIQSGEVQTHRAVLCYGKDCQRREWDLYKNPRIAGNVLELEMAWGSETLALPLDTPIVFRYENLGE